MPRIAIQNRPKDPAHPRDPEIDFYHPNTYIAPLPSNSRPTRLQSLLQRNCPRVDPPDANRDAPGTILHTQTPIPEFTRFPTNHAGSLLFPRLTNYSREHLFLHIWDLQRLLLDYQDQIDRLNKYLTEDRDMLQYNSSNKRFQEDSLKLLNKNLRARETDIEELREDYAGLEERYDEQTEKIEELEAGDGAVLAEMTAEVVRLKQENAFLWEKLPLGMRVGVGFSKGQMGQGVEIHSPGWDHVQQPRRSVQGQGTDMMGQPVHTHLPDWNHVQQPQTPTEWQGSQMTGHGAEMHSPGWNCVQRPWMPEPNQGAEIFERNVDCRVLDPMLGVDEILNAPASSVLVTDIAHQTPELKLGEQTERVPTPSPTSDHGSLGTTVSVRDRVRKFEALSSASGTPVEPARKIARGNIFDGGMASGA